MLLRKYLFFTWACIQSNERHYQPVQPENWKGNLLASDLVICVNECTAGPFVTRFARNHAFVTEGFMSELYKEDGRRTSIRRFFVRWLHTFLLVAETNNLGFHFFNRFQGVEMFGIPWCQHLGMSPCQHRESWHRNIPSCWHLVEMQ